MKNPKLVIFSVNADALYDFTKGWPREKRTQLRALEWSNTRREHVFTPPLVEAPASNVRSLLAGFEGLTETDVTHEYEFFLTTAGKNYDGFSTIDLGEIVKEGDNFGHTWRMVATRSEDVE